MRGLAWALCLLTLCGCARAVDLDGRPVDPLAGSAVTALIFVGTGCPISNRSAPELARLQQRWQGRGVAFYLVYPDDAADAVRRHLAEYKLTLPALRDPGHRLTRAHGVTTTPTALLFAGRRLLYRGRIDDRALDFARERPQALLHHDLDDALAAVVAGRAPPVAETPLFGCIIADPQ